MIIDYFIYNSDRSEYHHIIMKCNSVRFLA